MLIPTKDTQQYADLLALHQHMAHAGVEQLGFPNPLYNMETPDASHVSTRPPGKKSPPPLRAFLSRE